MDANPLLFVVVGIVLTLLWFARRRRAAGNTTPQHTPNGPVTLRETRDSDGVRLLTAALQDGDLVIEGRDYGEGVERIVGYREYEWVWTVKAQDVPRLLEALGEPSDVTGALRDKFSAEAAADLGPFLDAHGIPYETWSRTGD